MRLYFDVKLTTPQTIFLPDTLFFAPTDEIDNGDIDENHIVKLETTHAESSSFSKKNNKEFSIRWKDIYLTKGKDEYDMDFTFDMLKKFLKGKRLYNMEANLDYDTEVNVISGITIKTPDGDYNIPNEMIDIISFDGVDNYD